MCFYAIAAKYIAQLAAAHTQDDKIDTTWLNVLLLARPNLTSSGHLRGRSIVSTDEGV